jgi:hypothetical protein
VLRFLPLPGWREREALTLRWDGIDLARGLAMLADTKTGRSVRELGPPGLAVVGAVRGRPAGNLVGTSRKCAAEFTLSAVATARTVPSRRAPGP